MAAATLATLLLHHGNIVIDQCAHNGDTLQIINVKPELPARADQLINETFVISPTIAYVRPYWIRIDHHRGGQIRVGGALRRHDDSVMSINAIGWGDSIEEAINNMGRSS